MVSSRSRRNPLIFPEGLLCRTDVVDIGLFVFIGWTFTRAPNGTVRQLKGELNRRVHKMCGHLVSHLQGESNRRVHKMCGHLRVGLAQFGHSNNTPVLLPTSFL